MSAVVYRIFNECGDLLYVGCTISLGSRVASHVGRRDWSAEIAKVTVEHFATPYEAEAAEAAAIVGEKPKYNRTVTTPNDGVKRGRPRIGETRESQHEPWKALGMSERTWYRRKAEQRAQQK